MLAMTLVHIGPISLGIGGILAIILSWTRNSSILFAALHALMGWVYVIYWFLTGGARQ